MAVSLAIDVGIPDPVSPAAAWNWTTWRHTAKVLESHGPIVRADTMPE
jgi:hypothetical protein